MPGARHCYPAPHCCKQLISNSIDLELRANSIELIANSIQTRGARLSLALPPEKASSLWTDKRRRSKRTLKARNLHTFTSASAKQLQHHTLCIDHQRFVTPELNTAPRQNTRVSLASWTQVPELLPPQPPHYLEYKQTESSVWRFPTCGCSAEGPQKEQSSSANWPALLRPYRPDPPHPVFTTWFSHQDVSKGKCQGGTQMLCCP